MDEYFKPLSDSDRIHDGVNLVPRSIEEREPYNLGFDLDLKDLAYAAFETEQKTDEAWMTFTPDYAKVNGVLKRKWNFYKGKYHKKNNISDMRLAGSRLPFDRRELYVLQQFNGALHNQFEIRVGFLTPYDSHTSWDGKHSITILYLYRILLALGFDPLLVIRRKDFVASVREKMASAIIDRINDRNVNDISPKIKARLIPLANSIRDLVKDYITGGVKPVLATKTLSNRRWRAKRDGGLYSAGLTEALYETGQLCDAIQVEVVTWRDKYAIAKQYQKIHTPSDKATKRQELAAKKAQKEEKAQIEKLKKQQKSVREYNETVKKLGSKGTEKAEKELAKFISNKLDEEARKRAQEKSSVIRTGLYKGFTQKQVESARGDYDFLISVMKSNKARGAVGPTYGLSATQVSIFKAAREILRIQGRIN